MKRTIAAAAALGAVFWGAWAQAPQMFELRLPDFTAVPVGQGQTAVELAERPIRRMDVVVVDAQQRSISPSAIRVWVNGKGAGNVLESRNLAEGTVMSMNPATLDMRPDEIFDPRENTIEVLASDRRGRRYYQNWILRTSAARNSMFSYSGTVAPDDPGGVPPDILLDLPTQPPVIPAGKPSAEVLLKGTLAAADAGAAFTIDGENVSSEAIPSTYPFERKIVARRGKQAIVLEAVDKKGHRRTLAIPVIQQESTPSRVRFAGQKYALVVGISRYGGSNDVPPPLFAAASDASELARQLVSAGGFKPENVRVLTDEKATLEQLRVGFYDFAAKAGKDDLLLVYVSAYGFHDPRPGKPESLYLAVHGTRLPQLESTALAFEELNQLLDRAVRANHSFLVFDVGHQLPEQWRSPGHNLINNRVLNTFSEERGRAVLVSGSADQVSQTRDSDSARVFNHWLLRGLAGGADTNLDKIVTATELFGFVTEQVRQETGQQQTPRFRIGGAQSATALF